jgi:hypothetical protein
LRQTPDNTNNDNGLVLQQNLRDRIERNCRRVWAQEELTFTVDLLETVNPPCDMLTVGDPDGNDASGHREGSVLQGQVGMTITVQPLAGGMPAQVAIGPILITANDPPVTTAGNIQQAIALAGNGLNARVSACAPEGAALQGSADIIITCAGGHATVTAISPDDEQDSAQPVEVVRFNINAVSDEQFPSQSRKGGEPMRRQLFKTYAVDPQRINVFVVREARGGLTTSALDYLPNHPADNDVMNCVSMDAPNVDGNLDQNPLTLPHEFGHALTDADHSEFLPTGCLMIAGQLMTGNTDDTKRVSAQPHTVTIDRVADVTYQPLVAFNNPPTGPLGVKRVITDLHQLIAANGSLTLNNR